MKLIKQICILTIMVLLMIGTGYARDLNQQIGIGFNSQLSPNENDAISAKYWLNPNLCLQAMAGFSFSDEVNEIDLGGKVLLKMIDEENMYVYAGGGTGIANVDPDQGDGDTAFWLGGFVGLEFFLSGLPNLGFSTEVGLKIYDYNDNTTFGTDSDTFLSAGIHYYFGAVDGIRRRPDTTPASATPITKETPQNLPVKPQE